MHFSHTPEALLGRNDSKNPNTTCKGITSSGRPCRRALASSKATLIGRSRSNNSALGGVVALVHEDGELQEADFYCWQHKDQAAQKLEDEVANTNALAGRRPNRRTTELYPLKEKSSIDTMVQKLGIDAAEDGGGRTSRKPTRNPKAPRRTSTVDFATTQSRPPGPPYAEKYKLGGTRPSPQRKPKKSGFWASLCCMAGDDDDYFEGVRYKKRTETRQWPPAPSPNGAAPSPRPIPARKPVASSPHPPPSNQRRTASNTETTNILSLIPAHLPPHTTSALLAELTKPISPQDEEGYIYIFWLTPQSKDAPAESTARSLLSPPDSTGRPPHQRRISDVMTEYSYDGDDTSPDRNARRNGHPASEKRTILLKIGRANNITRRMNEWQRQCGYALNLVRWYPYVSSSPQPSPRSERHVLYPDLSRQQSRPDGGRRESSGTAVHKVPCVKRVERLIHLELAERQAKRRCAACGKEHREWFEVEASQAGVRAVDEVVRRWVAWGEGQVDT